jgi:hypothetical protein
MAVYIFYEKEYLKIFEMWRCKRKETISWADRMNNKSLLHKVKEERNISHKIKLKEG